MSEHTVNLTLGLCILTFIFVAPPACLYILGVLLTARVALHDVVLMAALAVLAMLAWCALMWQVLK